MDCKTLEKNLKCSLDLKRRVIGVKFAYTEDDFNKFDAIKVKYKLSYCSMVQLATKGKCLKANFEGSNCSGATRALGMEPLDKYCDTGYRYYYLNMYNSMCVAKNVHRQANLISHSIYGIMTKPLEYYVNEEPDVVIMIVNPYQAMRVTQGYSYSYGICKNIQFAGNQGLCLECTTRPYETNDMNVSVLCSNTRFLSKWDKSEMGIGIPFNKFPTLVDGVMKTINATEMDSTKCSIKKEADTEGLDFSHVTYGSSYY